MLANHSELSPPSLDEIVALRKEVADLRTLLHGLDYERRPTGGSDQGREARIEIARMVRQISRVKTEVASITQANEPDDIIGTANRQLESIIQSTEDATNGIMAATDEVEELVKKIRMSSPDQAQIGQVLEEISVRLITIIEACGFQDLTGQRIVKVVQTLRFLEQRILGMIEIWGLEAFRDIPVEAKPADSDDDDRDPGEILDGPAFEGEGLSQDDIDALFD
jgi:chemotaxis protein CheZ